MSDPISIVAALIRDEAGPQAMGKRCPDICQRLGERQKAKLRRGVQLRDLGLASTTLNRDPARLRHIALVDPGEETVHLWLDDAGRLMKVEIPSRHLIVERLAGS